MPDDDAPLEQQLFDVAHAQAESEIPANGATDDDREEAVVVTKRFRLVHLFIPPAHQPDTAIQKPYYAEVPI